MLIVINIEAISYKMNFSTICCAALSVFLVLQSSRWGKESCLVTVSFLCLLLTVRWVGLGCVIVAFPGHTHLLFKDNIVYGK